MYTSTYVCAGDDGDDGSGGAGGGDVQPQPHHKS